MSLGQELRRRFEQTLRAELDAPDARALPAGWPQLRLPPALREAQGQKPLPSCVEMSWTSSR